MAAAVLADQAGAGMMAATHESAAETPRFQLT